MLRTPVCHTLGIEVPIFSAGISAAAGPELAAAVSNAGGCGVLGASRFPAPYLREKIRRVRALTQRPFGVNIIIDKPAMETVVVCLEERVPVLVLFWGDPRPYVEPAHRNGSRVVMQVGSVAEAKAAVEAGVDGVMAQGFEAGGHVRGTTAVSVLVPSVVDAVGAIPVISAGGVADGRGLAAMLCLGAQAVSIGTRFLGSEESFVPPEYKERLLRSNAEDTVYAADLFDVGWPDAPHRVIRNRVVAEWEAAGRLTGDKRPGSGSVVGTRTRAGQTVEIEKYESVMVTPEFDGDLEGVPLWAGQTASLVHEIKPAGQIVREIASEAETVIAKLAQLAAGRPIPA